MPRKKPIELVQEVGSPKALIINSASVSSFLEETLKERGCEVKKLETYSPIHNRFDYIFLFDNQEIADEIFEKNLAKGGKFILVLTAEAEITRTEKDFRPKFKILKVGDPSFWSMPELSEKILSTLFSARTSIIVDLHRKAKVSPVAKKETVEARKERVPEIERIDLVEKAPRSNFKKIMAVFFLVVIFFIFALAITTYWYFKNLQRTFASLNWHLKSGNITLLTSDFQNMKQEVKTLQSIYNFSTNILFPVKNISYTKDIGVLLDRLEKVVNSGAGFAATIAEILPTKSRFVTTGEDLSEDKLKILEKQLADFAATLMATQEKVDKVSLPYFPKESIKASLSPTVSKLTAAYEILSVFKQVFFVATPKVYLVLFQNNMELRPTGGFIGSYGLLTVSGGKVVDFKIEDVYTADGQLKGHVDPPLPIRKYLQQPHFFLRDSNFNPDFAQSAAQAAWFLQKERGKNVDGVIGVNLTLAQKLMQVVGAIKLSDFGGEEITADNFFYKVHYYSSADFFPGSTQKKDILTAVSNGILAKLDESGGSNSLELLPIVKQALEEKNILIYVAEASLQKIIEDHGWAGRMVKVGCVARKDESGEQVLTYSDTCLPDFLSINEANLGVNKANYFINKSTIVEKKIAANGEISTTVTISYENSNTTLIDKSQTYVNYLRIFVPVGSKLESLTLNNAPLSPADLDTETYGSDKTVFGFLVKIAPDNRGVVKITYTLPQLLSNKFTSYQLFYQKQAGDKNSPLIFSLSYPAEYKLTPVNFASVTQRENEVFYTTDTSVDRVFVVKKE